jgi:hypothetical protein
MNGPLLLMVAAQAIGIAWITYTGNGFDPVVFVCLVVACCAGAVAGSRA